MKLTNTRAGFIRSFPLEGILFVVLISAIIHVSYSWIGFSPTDEGYMLAGSRRILDGQIPYRDYLSLRPVGTHFLHAHLLFWASDRLIWWSRLISILQLAVSSWFWVRITESFLGSFQILHRWSAAILGTLCSIGVHTMMPWNTSDGVFFISAGVLVHQVYHRRFLGLALIGSSVLFRQNFVFAIPLVLLLLQKEFSARDWIAALLPGAAFMIYLLLTGGFGPALGQLTGRGGSLATVLLFPFYVYYVPIFQGLLAGGVGFFLLYHDRSALQRGGLQLLGISSAYSSFLIPLDGAWGNTGWFLSAAVLGALAFVPKRSDFVRPVLLVIVLAIVSSISLGVVTPTFACCAIVPVWTGLISRRALEIRIRPWAIHMVFLVALAIGARGFHGGRIIVHGGRDVTAPTEVRDRHFQHDLGDALRGGRGVFASRGTWEYLSELTAATDEIRARGRRYAVIPETAQFWVTSPQPNPLWSDWPIDGEIFAPEFSMRICRELDGLRGSGSIVVQKYFAESLPFRRKPIGEGSSIAVDYVRKSFRLVKETEYLEIYE